MPICFAVKSHAHGTSNPGYRVRVYNDLLASYLASSAGLQGPAASAEFRRLLGSTNPKLSAAFSKEYGPKSGIQSFLSYLFPMPQCPQCGSPFKADLRHMHCSNRCYNLDIRGVAHHTQSPEVAKKRTATNIKRYGVANVSQADAIKAKKVETCRTNNGVDYPQQSARVRAKSIVSLVEHYGVDSPMRSLVLKKAAQQTNLKKRGVRNVSQDPAVKAVKVETNQDRYGVDNPSQRDLVKRLKSETTFLNHGVANPFQSEEIKTRISNERFKRTGFYNPSENPEVRAKATQTNLKRYGFECPFQNEGVKAKARTTNIERRGVPYPLQDLEVLQKVFKSQHRIKEMVYAGKKFRFQGWEDTVIRKLVDKYGKRDVITQFDGKYPAQVFKDSGTFPDLWIPSKSLYIEVKSRWTLMGKPEVLSLNKKKARSLDAAGHHCRWVVVLDKSKKCVTLPLDWYTLKTPALRTLLKEN